KRKPSSSSTGTNPTIRNRIRIHISMWFTTYPAIMPKHRVTITGQDTAATPAATGITMGIIHPMDTGKIAHTGAGRGYWRACFDKFLHARQIQCRALPRFPLQSGWENSWPYVNFEEVTPHIRWLKHSNPLIHILQVDTHRTLRRLKREQNPLSRLLFTS